VAWFKGFFSDMKLKKEHRDMEFLAGLEIWKMAVLKLYSKGKLRQLKKY
jgi:hypothetical protein